MKQIIVLALLFISLSATSQSVFKYGTITGRTDNVVEVDSIIISAGQIIFYSGGAAVGVLNDSVAILQAQINDTVSIDSIVRTKDDIITQLPFSIGGAIGGDSTSIVSGRIVTQLWYEGPDDFVVDSMRSRVDKGSCTIQWYFGTSGATAADSLFTAAQSITSTTTGDVDVPNKTATVPYRRYIWGVLKVVGSTSPTMVSCTLIGHLSNNE